MRYQPGMKPQAIIFDCDGVLIDSETIAVVILSEDLRELGLAVSAEQAHHRFVGWTSSQIAECVSQETGVPVPLDWVQRHVAAVDEAVATSVQPIDGALDVLDKLDAAGIPWGVASQSGMSYLERALGRVGIWERARGRVASSQMVARAKPAPDVYLKAMELVGATSARTVVVEDSQTGVRAGVAAGARVIGFAAVGDPAALRAAGASDTISAMADLPALIGLSQPATA